jgi:hypothetical protein
MEMAPAATSASPAVSTSVEDALAPESPAASAKGTVRPSETPMMMSRTTSPAVKCFSVCSSRLQQQPLLLLVLHERLAAVQRHLTPNAKSPRKSPVRSLLD